MRGIRPTRPYECIVVHVEQVCCDSYCSLIPLFRLGVLQMSASENIRHRMIGEKKECSPRCVMEQHLPMKTTERLSPVVEQERYNRHMIRNAKLFLLKSNHKEALRIGNQYLLEKLRDGWSGPLSYFQTTVKLSVPFIIPNENDSQDKNNTFFFQVRLGTQLTAVDEITTVVLQSWHELARKDSRNCSAQAWKHMLPLLQIYSRHPMPVQFFAQIWIPFWYSFPRSESNVVGANLALAWTLQVTMLLVQHSTRIDGMPPLLQEIRDQLVESLFTEQLPKLSSPSLATQMARVVLIPSEERCEPFIHQINDHLTPTNHPPTMQALQTVLEETKNTCPGISKEVQGRLLQYMELQNLPLETTSSRLSSSSSSLISKGKDSFFNLSMKFFRTQCESLLSPVIKSLLDRVCQQARSFLSPSFTNSENDLSLPQRKIQLAISILSLLVVWRHKRMFRRWGKIVSMTILSPITELVEVLVPASTMTNDRTI